MLDSLYEQLTRSVLEHKNKPEVISQAKEATVINLKDSIDFLTEADFHSYFFAYDIDEKTAEIITAGCITGGWPVTENTLNLALTSLLEDNTIREYHVNKLRNEVLLEW